VGRGVGALRTIRRHYREKPDGPGTARFTRTGTPGVDCIYVLDEAGAQVTETICNVNIVARDGGSMFRPAPAGADYSPKEDYYILLDGELRKYTPDRPIRDARQRQRLSHDQHLLPRRRE
jgi:hypothetical protein